jgi:hypothetical protein
MKPLLLLLCLSPLSTALSQEWMQTASSPKGSGVTDLAVNQLNGDLYATTGSFNWPNADTGGVHRSTDRGDTWTRLFPAFVARSIAVKSNGDVFASVWDYPVANEGLYRSTDDGTTWELAFSAGANNNVFSIAFDSVSFINPDVAYAGSRLGVYRSLAGGLPGTWALRTQGLPPTPWIRDLVVAPNGVLIAAVMNVSNPSMNGVYYSTDQGNNFLPASGIATGDTVSSLTVLVDTTASDSGPPLYVLAGTERGRVYRAAILLTGVQSFALLFTFPGTPGLAAWVYILLLGLAFVALYPTFGSGGGIAYTQSGALWFFLLIGLPTLYLMSALAYYTNLTEGGDQYTLYSGTFMNQNNGAQVYRLDLATGVTQSSSEVPEHFSLKQNYPNPFNPKTEIEFDIRHSSFITLKVYDVLGNEITTLVSGQKSPGSYTVAWDATGQPSGVYFYRLTAGDLVATRKMMLLR